MEKLIKQEEWDVAVIGAGPAGSIAAYEIAKSGCSVLLVDKAQFPRTKVCGSCLNRRSLALLKKTGIKDLETQLNAPEIREFHFAANHNHVSFKFSGRSISREKLDRFLIDEAVKQGIYFLPNTRAVVGEADDFYRAVTLLNHHRNQNIKARVILIADGLSGNALKQPSHVHIRPKSRIGVSTIVNEGPAFYQAGTIYMAYSRDGYVGAVRLEDGRIDIAAALHPVLVKEGIQQSVTKIWKEAGFPQIETVENAQWLGTPFLSRSQKSLSGRRFFMIGDAAGYTEPFTGEGISWALESGIAVAPIAVQAVSKWSDDYGRDWNQSYRRLIGRKQSISKWMMISLRHPFLVRCAVELLKKIPMLANLLIKNFEP